MAAVPARDRYKRWPGWLALAMVVAALLAVGVARGRDPQTADQRVRSIAERVACPVCNGESVAESQAPVSQDIVQNIEQLVADGQLDDGQIIAEIDARYEGDQRLVPGGRGIEGLIWALPALAAVGGVAGLFAAFNRWRRRVPPAALTADDRALVDAALGGSGNGEPSEEPQG